MRLTRRRTDLLTITAIAFALLAGVLTFTDLPARIAIHFDPSGTPNTYVPRTIGILLIPILMTVTAIALRYSPRLDPTANVAVLYVTTVASMALLGAIQMVVLAVNLGFDVDMTLVLGGVLVWTAGVVGYALYRERNK